MILQNPLIKVSMFKLSRQLCHVNVYVLSSSCSTINVVLDTYTPKMDKSWAKVGQKLGKFCPELKQKFTISSGTLLNASLLGLMKFHFTSVCLGLKSFGSHKFCSYRDSTVSNNLGWQYRPMSNLLNPMSIVQKNFLSISNQVYY